VYNNSVKNVLTDVWQAELSELRDTVNELEAAKASVQQELQRYQQLYVHEVDVSNELHRKLKTAKQVAAAGTQRTG